MASDLRAIGVSHTPVFGHPSGVTPPQEEKVREAYALLAADVERFDPELVIVFAPDHFIAFDYGAMPAFCIGFNGSGAGDFHGPSGAASIDAAAASDCHKALNDAGFDPAVSYRMNLDHGYTQPLHMLFGGLDRRPLLPIFINCAAPPLPSFRRTFAFGDAVGRWAGALERRVLLIGSGGLSHDPPVPSIEGAPRELFDFMVTASGRSAADRKPQEDMVMQLVGEFAKGKSDLLALNPAWDRWLLERLTSGQLEDIANLADDEVFREGGRGGQEVRTWLAAFAALQSAGSYRAKPFFYDAIPEWLAGMGMIAGRTAA